MVAAAVVVRFIGIRFGEITREKKEQHITLWHSGNLPPPHLQHASRLHSHVLVITRPHSIQNVPN